MLDRAQLLLGSVPKTSRIVEIGPSLDPIAPKSQGWNSVSIDHLSREGLRVKYATHPGVDRIEPVDFVWSSGLLSDAVPAEQHGGFDVFLASHVIEHTPDLIGFLDAAQILLKPEGVVVLAVPDKRYCFDYFQPPTTTGQVLDAHARRRQRHSGERAFDHFAYAATDGGEQAWARRPSKGIRLIHGLDIAKQYYALFEDSLDYHDVHAWHFVPSSFELLMLELGRLGATDWRIDRLTQTPNWEFFVWLRRGAVAQIGALTAACVETRRVTLLKRSLLEIQEQIDWLVASEPELAEERALAADEATLPMTQAALTPLQQSRAEIAGLHGRLLESEAIAVDATRRLADMHNATFWRATAPLRRLLDWLRRIAGGGVAESAFQAISVTADKWTTTRFVATRSSLSGMRWNKARRCNARSAAVPCTSRNGNFIVGSARRFTRSRAGFRCCCRQPRLRPSPSKSWARSTFRWPGRTRSQPR